MVEGGAGSRSVVCGSGTDDEDGEFVEEVDGEEYDHQGERVAGRSNDSGKYKQNHDGVATVFTKYPLVENAEFREHPCKHGELENQSHHEDN